MRRPLELVLLASTCLGACASEPASPPVAPVAAPAASGDRVTVRVTDEGFIPARIPAKKGKPLVLVITREVGKTCATEIQFDGQPGSTELPIGKAVEVTYTPARTGDIKFGCAMGMMIGGVLAVVE